MMKKKKIKVSSHFTFMVVLFVSLTYFVSCQPDKSDFKENLPPMLKINETMFGVSFQFPCRYDNIKKIQYSLNKIFNKKNSGILIKVIPQSPILASSKGKVERIEISKFNYKYYKLVIRHSINVKTVYSKLTEVQVDEGANVNSGEIIGKSSDKFNFQIFIRKDFLEKNKLSSYIENQNKDILWVDIFPLILIFGEDSYNAKN